jgi:hypothetical protein
MELALSSRDYEGRAEYLGNQSNETESAANS